MAKQNQMQDVCIKSWIGRHEQVVVVYLFNNQNPTPFGLGWAHLALDCVGSASDCRVWHSLPKDASMSSQVFSGVRRRQKRRRGNQTQTAEHSPQIQRTVDGQNPLFIGESLFQGFRSTISLERQGPAINIFDKRSPATDPVVALSPLQEMADAWLTWPAEAVSNNGGSNPPWVDFYVLSPSENTCFCRVRMYHENWNSMHLWFVFGWKNQPGGLTRQTNQLIVAGKNLSKLPYVTADSDYQNHEWVMNAHERFRQSGYHEHCVGRWCLLEPLPTFAESKSNEKSDKLWFPLQLEIIPCAWPPGQVSAQLFFLNP